LSSKNCEKGASDESQDEHEGGQRTVGQLILKGFPNGPEAAVMIHEVLANKIEDAPKG